MVKFISVAISLLLMAIRASSKSAPTHEERKLETWTPCGVRSCNSREDCLPDEEENMGCVCKIGWTGSTCLEGADECKTMEACSFPGGYCEDRHPNEGRYACGCDTSKNHWEESTNSSSFNDHGSTECFDVDECVAWDSPCATDANCTNTIGSFSCECGAGFEGDGYTSCEPPPIDTELPGCEDGMCDLSNSFCDSEVSKCRCLPGYFSGSLGLTCQDSDECEVAERNDCHENADCTNLIGSYSCKCMAGYKDVSAAGDGTDCAQLDECKEGGHDCELSIEDCIDIAPPEMWKCEVRPVDPTMAPTPVPPPQAAPVPTPDILPPPKSSMPSSTPSLMPLPPAPLVLKLQSDKFGYETSYRLYDVVNEQLLWSEATVESNALTQEEIALDPRGCYFFLVHDLFVDGVCCEFGSGSVDLVFDGVNVALSEFDNALSESAGYKHMAHAYIGSGCADAPFLPSALDSTCYSECGATTLRPSGCSCDCLMTDTQRSRNNEAAVAFGDCCPDYVAMCTEPASAAVGTVGKFQVSYIKSNDGTMPSIALFNAKGLVESGSCDIPTGCEISIDVDSDGLICSEMQLRINESSEAWIFAEDVILSVTLDGESILSYEGNIFPSVLSFNCTLFS